MAKKKDSAVVETVETTEKVDTKTKASDGLRSAIRLGEITPKEAVRKLKKKQSDGFYVPADTMQYYMGRAARENKKAEKVEEE